jgi:hypothetical protein
MKTNKLDWTHKDIKITDIRKFGNVYIIEVTDDKFFSDNEQLNKLNEIIKPLFIKDTIFEERLRSYFLKNVSQISREDILNVRWNMYITQGYYIKMDEYGKAVHRNMDPEKWYVSYLDINGPLGSFESITYNKK